MVERFKTFTVLIANITRSIRKIKTEEMAKWNLRSHHVSCLYYLYERDTLTSKELCDICGEDKANLSRSIEYLEEQGFIKCEDNAHKRYKSHFVLTEKGKIVGKDIFNCVEDILRESSIGLSEEHRDIMYQSLRTINDNLQKISDEYRN